MFAPGERLIVVRTETTKPREGDMVVCVRLERLAIPFAEPSSSTKSQPKNLNTPRVRTWKSVFIEFCGDTGRLLPRLMGRWGDLFTQAFGLIAALAWNEAVQDMIDKTELIQATKLIYALSLTIVAVLIAYLIEVSGHLMEKTWDVAAERMHLHEQHGMTALLVQQQQQQQQQQSSVGARRPATPFFGQMTEIQHATLSKKR
jgi:hypothetical protein